MQHPLRRSDSHSRPVPNPRARKRPSGPVRRPNDPSAKSPPAIIWLNGELVLRQVGSMDSIGNVRPPLKAAWPPSRFQLPYTMRLSHGCLFGLLLTLGLLAFFLSVVSPYDDDVQQEFIQGKKPKQCVVVNCKTARAVHTLDKHKFRSALLPQRLLTICCSVVRHPLVPDEKILRTIASSGIGDRSPPSRPS